MELIGVSWAQIGVGGLLTIVVLLILSGRLVPRSALEDLKKERDDWKQSFLRQQEQNVVQTGQIEQLMVVGRTAEHLIRSLPPIEYPPRRPVMEAQYGSEEG